MKCGNCRKTTLLSVLLYIIFVIGCCDPRFGNPPPLNIPHTNHLLVDMPDVIVWSNYRENGGPDWWYLEARKKFDHPILFMCHGGDRGGHWYVVPDAPRVERPAKEVAQMLHNLYPGRPIVFAVCNPLHETLDVPGVWYPKEDIWVTPDNGVADFVNIYRKESKYIGSLDGFTAPPN